MSDFSEEKFRNDLVSSELQKMYKDLLKSLLKESCVKHLKNLSMNEVSGVTDNCILPNDKEYQKRKMHFAEIKTLTGTIDGAITNLINNAFSDSYRSDLKMKISQAFINASSAKSTENKNASSTREPVFISEYIVLDDKEDIEEINIMSKRYVENLRNISQEMIEIPLEEALASSKIEAITSDFEIKEEYDISDLDDACSISVSSVHTSALSSFDDEISISSDEETGRKRKRLSLKKIKEDAEKLHEERKKSTFAADVTTDVKEEINSDSHDSDFPINVDGITEDEDSLEIKNETKKRNKRVLAQPEKLQNASSSRKRIRKPNLKYASEDMVSPFSMDAMNFEKNKEDKEDSNLSQPRNKRKRGRPRKCV